MVKPVLKQIKEILLNLFFPCFCVGCGKECSPAGGFLCQKCQQTIVPVVSQVCPECGKLSENGKYHQKCSKDKAIKGVICAAYFEEGPVREMIHNLKYNSVTELAEPLGKLMAEVLRDNFKLQILNFKSNSNDKNFNIKNSLKIENLKLLITWVPLHWRRQAQRGYNQSELLARGIGERIGLEVKNILVKKKSTKRQAELSGEKRRKNLKSVFQLKNGVDLSNLGNLRNLVFIIVDDVCATGSTLNECGRVLKRAGAKEVWGLVVCRG